MLRPRAALLLAALCLGLAPAAAYAGRRAAPPVPVPAPEVKSPPEVEGVCTIGIDGPEANVIDYIFPPDDEYFSLLEPTECGACTSWVLGTAHIKLEFRVACTQPVVVRIVEAYGQVCPVPDPGKQLCLPFETNLVADDSGIFDFAITLPVGCRIQRPAFLGINFVRDSKTCFMSNDRPRLVLDDGCTRCQSYNYVSGSSEDLCGSVALLGQPIIYAEVTECSTTPTLKRSWGSVKSIYR